MAPNFLPFLFIFYLSSALLSPGTTVCVPRSGPYNNLLRDHLPPPKSVDGSSDSYADSPSPSTSPSTRPSSPESSSVTFSDTSGPHIFDSDATSPSPSPSTSPSMKSSSPQSVKPPPSSSSSPTPKSATVPSTTPTPSSSTPSRSPLSSPTLPVSSTTSPPTPKSTPSPSKTPSSSPSDAPSTSGMVEAVVSATADAASFAVKATSNAASSVTKAIKSKMTDSDKLINVLDGSLNAICDKLPFPDLCMAELPSAAEDDIKAIDLNGALGLAITDLLIEARAARDKARTLATNDFVYDPINLCNRTMGGALSDSKDALDSYELKDWGSVKSNFDSYVHRLGVCTEKTPEGLTAEMEKIDKLWQNANAILCTIDPTLKPAR